MREEDDYEQQMGKDWKKEVVMAYLKVLPYHFPYLSQVSWYNDQQSN
jgi:hypothetical protein